MNQRSLLLLLTLTLHHALTLTHLARRVTHTPIVRLSAGCLSIKLRGASAKFARKLRSTAFGKGETFDRERGKRECRSNVVRFDVSAMSACERREIYVRTGCVFIFPPLREIAFPSPRAHISVRVARTTMIRALHDDQFTVRISVRAAQPREIVVERSPQTFSTFDASVSERPLTELRQRPFSPSVPVLPLVLSFSLRAPGGRPRREEGARCGSGRE